MFSFKASSFKFDPNSPAARKLVTDLVLAFAASDYDKSLKVQLRGYPDDVYTADWLDFHAPPAVQSFAVMKAVDTLSPLFITEILKALTTPLSSGTVSFDLMRNMVDELDNYRPWFLLNDDCVRKALGPLLPTLYNDVAPLVRKTCEEEDWPLKAMIAQVKASGYTVTEKKKRPSRAVRFSPRPIRED